MSKAPYKAFHSSNPCIKPLIPFLAKSQQATSSGNLNSFTEPRGGTMNTLIIWVRSSLEARRL